MGTVAYMSPEQARGETVDHRSDLFSFGVMLYEMACGERPFQGKSELDSLSATINTEPRPLSEIGQDIPAEMDRVVRKAMEKEPERRYQDAVDLATDLKNLKRGLDTGRTSIPSGPVATLALLRRQTWTIAAGVCLVAILIAGATYLFYGRSADDTVVSQTENRAIAVVGFENLNDPTDSDRLGRMLMALITTDLAESGGLTVVSTPKVLAALRQVSTSEGFDAAVASEAAKAAGAQVMLVGQIGKAGERLILTAELIDVESGTILTSQKREAASDAELFDLAGAIGAEVRERLGSGSGAAFDLAEALTSSPEAYRHYAVGEIALHQRRWQEAVESLGRAVKEDPTFALAYYRRAFAQDWYGDAERARASLERGLPYIDRLPLRWQSMYRAFQEYNKRSYDAAYEMLSKLIEASTDIPDAYYILGEISVHPARYFDMKKARKLFETALDVDPTYKVVFYHLIDCYIAGDDIAAAKRLIERYRADDPSDPAIAPAEIKILRAEGKMDEAIARAEDSFLVGDERCWLSLMTGNWELAFTCADEVLQSSDVYQTTWGTLRTRGLAQSGRGRISEALADLEKAAELTRNNTTTRPLGAEYLVQRARLLEAVGDVEEATETARKAVALEPYAFGGSFYLGRLLLDAGKSADAEEALTRLQHLDRESESPLGEFFEHLLHAEIELAKDNLKAAEMALEQASSLAPEHRNRTAELETRARIREASGDRAGAIAAYREVLKPINQCGHTFVSSSPVHTTLALYELARLEDEAGDVASARQHYQDFLDRWGDADLPIPAVAKAKARMATLARQ